MPTQLEMMSQGNTATEKNQVPENHVKEICSYTREKVNESNEQDRVHRTNSYNHHPVTTYEYHTPEYPTREISYQRTKETASDQAKSSQSHYSTDNSEHAETLDKRSSDAYVQSPSYFQSKPESQSQSQSQPKTHRYSYSQSSPSPPYPQPLSHTHSQANHEPGLPYYSQGPTNSLHSSYSSYKTNPSPREQYKHARQSISPKKNYPPQPSYHHSNDNYQSPSQYSESHEKTPVYIYRSERGSTEYSQKPHESQLRSHELSAISKVRLSERPSGESQVRYSPYNNETYGRSSPATSGPSEQYYGVYGRGAEIQTGASEYKHRSPEVYYNFSQERRATHDFPPQSQPSHVYRSEKTSDLDHPVHPAHPAHPSHHWSYKSHESDYLNKERSDHPNVHSSSSNVPRYPYHSSSYNTQRYPHPNEVPSSRNRDIPPSEVYYRNSGQGQRQSPPLDYYHPSSRDKDMSQHEKKDDPKQSADFALAEKISQLQAKAKQKTAPAYPGLYSWQTEEKVSSPLTAAASTASSSSTGKPPAPTAASMQSIWLPLKKKNRAKPKTRKAYIVKKELKCEVCSRLYSSTSSLRNHFRMKHTFN